jgi:hypothetical protein
MTSYLAAVTMRAGAACSGAADVRPIAGIGNSRICLGMAVLVLIGNAVAAGDHCSKSNSRAKVEPPGLEWSEYGERKGFFLCTMPSGERVIQAPTSCFTCNKIGNCYLRREIVLHT